MTKYVNQTGEPAAQLARKASEAFLRTRGNEMYAAHVKNLYDSEVPEPGRRDHFREGLRMGFAAAFLTILSLDETDNGETAQPDGVVGQVGTEAGVGVRQPGPHLP